jgi:1,4-alpha-glucan branching enzyme
MATGYLALVLNAHLPYVRPAARRPRPQEWWFYEHARECYLPLIRILDHLERDQVRARLTIALSPPLIATMRDPLVRQRFSEHLDQMLELSARELNRTALQPELRNLTGTYHLRLLQMRNVLADRCGGDLLAALLDLESRGRLELITGPATYAILPRLAAIQPRAARSQVRLGLDAFEQMLGHASPGLWLPECAYSPSLDAILGEENAGYIVLDGSSLAGAATPPAHGPFAPVYCPSGVAAFGRDHEGSRLAGCDTSGQPVHALYRNNARDIADEVDFEYLRPHVLCEGAPLTTGFCYHRIGGGNGESTIYRRKQALDLAAQHAAEFLHDQIRRTQELEGRMDRPPLFVAAYDMHVFGYRWFEGVEFLDYLFRKTQHDQDVIETITPLEYLDRHRCNEMLQPSQSSWGQNGDVESWTRGDSDWVYQHLSRAARVMQQISEAVWAEREGGNGRNASTETGPLSNGNDLPSRALRAAGRQLMLAQASDWTVMLRDERRQEYGRNRLALHLENFDRIASQIRNRRIRAEEIDQLERDWPIFGEIRTDAYQ